jgi:hypothetical protein
MPLRLAIPPLTLVAFLTAVRWLPSASIGGEARLFGLVVGGMAVVASLRLWFTPVEYRDVDETGLAIIDEPQSTRVEPGDIAWACVFPRAFGTQEMIVSLRSGRRLPVYLGDIRPRQVDVLLRCGVSVIGRSRRALERDDELEARYRSFLDRED